MCLNRHYYPVIGILRRTSGIRFETLLHQTDGFLRLYMYLLSQDNKLTDVVMYYWISINILLSVINTTCLIIISRIIFIAFQNRLSRTCNNSSFHLEELYKVRLFVGSLRAFAIWFSSPLSPSVLFCSLKLGGCGLMFYDNI